ncbi:hypothetical protein AVEN_52301-1 [Araneus ventricosus]|uniref:Uncharacterized protein n=1 Tax=Araneus ventricosus TaxID=182803 RepID=A0A4Y2GMH1_ARAVE|nr:hypothetical protein AVEN_52301-1 [Araneus ventricosus]
MDRFIPFSEDENLDSSSEENDQLIDAVMQSISNNADYSNEAHRKHLSSIIINNSKNNSTFLKKFNDFYGNKIMLKILLGYKIITFTLLADAVAPYSN